MRNLFRLWIEPATSGRGVDRSRLSQEAILWIPKRSGLVKQSKCNELASKKDEPHIRRKLRLSKEIRRLCCDEIYTWIVWTLVTLKLHRVQTFVCDLCNLVRSFVCNFVIPRWFLCVSCNYFLLKLCALILTFSDIFILCFKFVSKSVVFDYRLCWSNVHCCTCGVFPPHNSKPWPANGTTIPLCGLPVMTRSRILLRRIVWTTRFENLRNPGRIYFLISCNKCWNKITSNLKCGHMPSQRACTSEQTEI